MSYLMPNMPCGYASTGDKLTFSKVKSHAESVSFMGLRAVDIVDRFAKAVIPIDELSEKQRKNLAIDCWDHGCWYDFFIGDRHVTKEEAIAAVDKESSELGKMLVDQVMTGYSHIYKSLLPHNEEKYPLVKPKIKSRSALVSPSQVTSRPKEQLVTIHNNLSFDVFISYHCFDEPHPSQGEIIGRIPARGKEEKNLLINYVTGFNELVVVTKMARHLLFSPDLSGILSVYIAYPGCKTWNIDSFPTDSFPPSTWKLVDGKLQTPWEVRITNNLKTYVCIWQVLYNGSLHIVDGMSQQSSIKANPCYIGTSLVATQGGTVISKFFADSPACKNWSIGIDVSLDEEIYKTGDNNYIFYQVKTPQDDTVKPTAKDFGKQITIPSGIEFLYASLFDSCNAHFAVPVDVKVTIDSHDALGTTLHYNSNTNTDKLYIQMTKDGKSLQKLCVKNPVAGTWEITIKAMTNTPVFFQFQTVPTKYPYKMMEKTLSPLQLLIESKWEDIAYAGFTNIANNQKEKMMPTAVGAIGEALVTAKLWPSVIICLQNDKGDIKNATSTVQNAGASTPSELSNILLVDANGSDEATQLLYDGRYKYLYPEVQSGIFRDNCTKLVGENQATRELFETTLANHNFSLVSIAGHGNYNSVCGYMPPDTRILATEHVTEKLAGGKIYHILACNCAVTLGVALVRSGAIAFIGYKETFKVFSETVRTKRIAEADCIIPKALIDGKTVEEAWNDARERYHKLINGAPDANLIGMLENNRCALTYGGRGDARLR